MTCLHCLKLDLKSNPKHAKIGFGHCQSHAVGSFVSFSHPTCEMYKAAPKEIVEQRIEFEKREK